MCCLCQLGGWSATCRVSLLTVNTIEGWSGHLYLLRVEGRRQRGGVARAERLRDVHDRVQDLRRVRRVQRARAVALHQSEVSTWSRDPLSPPITAHLGHGQRAVEADLVAALPGPAHAAAHWGSPGIRASATSQYYGQYCNISGNNVVYRTVLIVALFCLVQLISLKAERSGV